MFTTAKKPSGVMRWQRIVLLLSFLMSLAGASASGSAAPGGLPNETLRAHQSPDWLSSDASSRLDLSFPVLVPETAPLPLSGDPDITSYDGFYQLYWMIPGAPPTFLQVTGEVGGSIPDYSKADRNTQLVQNAEVSGYPAYRDLTAIYDLVYWQIGDVVYSVESRNLENTDSLTVAESLISLTPTTPTENGENSSGSPAISVRDSVESGSTVEIDISGVDNAVLTADAGSFVSTGDRVVTELSDSTVAWQAPTTSNATSVLFVLSDSDTGDWITTANTLVEAGTADTGLALSCPESAAGGSDLEFNLSGGGYAVIDAADGEFPVVTANTAFAPDFVGGGTMVGTVPETGQVSLIWTAPLVEEARVVYLFASNDAGETPGECAIDVQVAGEVQAASLDAPEDSQVNGGAVSEAQSATNEAAANQSGQSENQAALSLQDDPAPTSTKKPTRTPKPYDELEGIPTSPSEGQGNGTPTVGRTPSTRPSATYAPTLLDDGTVASVIGPDGGSLVSPRGITVNVPPGALTTSATVSIQPLADTKVPTTNGVRPISGSGFDLTVAGANGRAIEKLEAPAEIRVKLDQKVVDAGARLYRVDGSSLVSIPNMRIEGDELVVSVTGFARIVAGSPVAVAASPKRNALPFILAAVVVIIAMIVMVLLAGMFRPRRQRVITNRRPSGTRHR